MIHNSNYKFLKLKYLLFISFIFIAVLFWFVRFDYWLSNSELPFSDLNDYVQISYGILESLNFSMSEFWTTYKPPFASLFFSIIFFMFGKENFLAVQISQTFFLFCSLMFLLYEMSKFFQSKIPPLIFFILTTFSSSSIFWSYKTGTESLSEAFLYLIIFYIFRILRKNDINIFLIALVSVLAILCRPNFIPLIMIIPLIIFYKYKVIYKTGDLGFIISIKYLLLVALFISPWMVRNYMVCDKPILISTQGPYSFLWEVGQFKYFNHNGDSFSLQNVESMQLMLPDIFKNDCYAHAQISKSVKVWINENYLTFPKIFLTRIKNQIFNDSIYLTKLPRNEMKFTYNFINFQKYPYLIIFSLLCWIFFIKNTVLFFTFLTYSSFVLFGALFLSYPRMLEPFIPLSNFGLILLWNKFVKKS